MKFDLEKVMILFFGIMMGFLFLALFLTLFIALPVGIYDSVYITPLVDQKANEHCQEKGFDFYEEYSRVGFLSKEPVAIICKYVEQYRDIDLNINREAKE